MSDVFQRIEARIVAIGEFLEIARRYRPLAAESESLYRTAARIGAAVRKASRAPGEPPAGLAALEQELESALEQPRRALADLLASPRYRALLESLAAGNRAQVSRLVGELFADVEPATLAGPLYFPLAAKRGEGVLEPEAAAEAIQRMSVDGIEPQPGPGVGGDASVRPIRFFEGSSGIDAAILVIVAGESVTEPAFRAPEMGELLVSAERLRVPFEVGLRSQSPDDWLEVRAGGYLQYRERCRELLVAGGFRVREV